MPNRKTIEKARKDEREGKSPSTQAGEHGARSAKQAIAIGLSEARRAGVDLPPPKKGKVKESTRKSAEYAYEVGQGERVPRRRPRVSKAVSEVLEHEPKDSASHEALSRQAKRAASRRTAGERSKAAEKAAETKGGSGRSAAARKAARTKGPRGRKEAARKAAETRAHHS
ncbi:DNA-binding protein [Labrys okinawensis]|uniref:DNA-binding protein n=1 Tax=Labrys okinawensis TaxID=346911 RepID=A0A2S9QIJ4_9HYPH|nr:DUF6496 domain-containing protein [Labrys okinawensis]PRH89155.1 DNA-binding protein [Labrys okinawensis]